MQLPVAMEAATNKGNSHEWEKSHVCLPVGRPALEIRCLVTGMDGAVCVCVERPFSFFPSPHVTVCGDG